MLRQETRKYLPQAVPKSTLSSKKTAKEDTSAQARQNNKLRILISSTVLKQQEY